MGNGIANYGRIDVISLPPAKTTEKHKTGWFIGNLSIMVVETFKEMFEFVPPKNWGEDWMPWLEKRCRWDGEWVAVV